MVRINRSRVADAMQVTPDAVMTLYQVHSADIIPVTHPLTGDLPRADGFVTRTPGLAISVLSADCQPVLFSDPQAGVVGAAHAGWKGALGGVLEATISAMEALGAHRKNIAAVIGPCISVDAYEVGPDFRDIFLKADPNHARFFKAGKEDRFMFNLPAFGLFVLQRAGIGHAEATGHCTYDDAERFYSYRRSVHNNEGDYGRLIASIRL